MSALLVEPRAADASPASVGIGRMRRPWPLVAHVLALAVVLAAGFAIVRGGDVQQADEGAALAQADQLAAGDGWRFAHPMPEVDPDGRAFSFDLSTRVQGTTDFVVFAKHPVYPVILSWAMRAAEAIGAAGAAGAIALSTLGTLVAALLSTRVARQIRFASERATLWLVGLGSPLLFDGYQAIAHTIGAAAAVVAVWGAVERGRSIAWRVALVVAGLGGAMVMRNEALLFGAALGVGLLVAAVRERLRAEAVLGVVAWAATLGAAMIDRALAAHVSRGPAGAPATSIRAPSPEAAQGFMAGRLAALRISVFAGADGSALASAAGYVAIGALLYGVVMFRRGDRGARLSGAAVVAATALVAQAVAAPGESVPGLLVAFPLLVVGVGVCTRAQVREHASMVLASTVTLFALAVAATQYANGGGGGWGGRYFAMALPAAAPLIVASVRRAGLGVPAAIGRRVVLALAVAHLALAGHALASLRLQHEWTAQLAAFVRTSAADDVPGDGDDRPVVVTTSPALARLSWARVDEARWLTVSPGDLAELTARLRSAGITTITFASAAPRAELATFAPGWTAATRPEAPSVDEPWHGPTGYGVFVAEVRFRG